MKDTLLIKTKALPAAGASALTDAIDLGVATADKLGLPKKVRFSLPALASLADDKNCTVELFDCDTAGGTYAVVPTTGNMAVTGAGGAGAAAKAWEFFLPPHCRQFVKGKATVDASGGDNTAKSLTFEFDL